MAAKGAVYGLVGIFAMGAAVGLGGKVEDFKGAMRLVDDHWWGRPLLLLIGVNLFAYALWRGMQAALDPENEHPQKTRVFKRLGYCVSAASHIALGYFAIKQILGAGDDGTSSDKSAKLLTGEAMSQPWGQWLIAAAGGGLIVFGIWHGYYGLAGRFRKKLETPKMSSAEEKLATLSGQYGHLARALLLVIVGGFLVKAALDYDPKEAKGLQGALSFVSARPFGSWALALVAAGLLAYAMFMFIQARYRRLPA